MAPYNESTELGSGDSHRSFHYGNTIYVSESEKVLQLV